MSLPILTKFCKHFLLLQLIDSLMLLDAGLDRGRGFFQHLDKLAQIFLGG